MCIWMSSYEYRFYTYLRLFYEILSNILKGNFETFDSYRVEKQRHVCSEKT